jgi:virulence-associated protein VapD
MNVAAIRRAAIGHNSRAGRPPVTYAISFDLDTKSLEDSYPSPSWQNAYYDIERSLRQHGFTRRQGSVYFGDDTVDVVRCQIAVQELALQYNWFAPAARDIRMLRIEENNDLRPAIELVVGLQRK